MWVKMTQEELTKSLDTGIRIYDKSKLRDFLGLTFLAMVLAVIINFVLFYPSKLFPINSVPTALEAIINFLIVFFPVETILSLILLRDFAKFRKLNLEEKRELIYGERKKKANLICPTCGIIYESDQIKCSKCGGALELSVDYMWVEPSGQTVVAPEKI